ncbi:hypothetical protein LCGC14_2137300 [marine sediment metagenome]|uniref:Uncharacterized protein n=1 Tax=marine sediment metagenome TaxID=412755 RepID=A0A0F9ELQ8_9ZZZZ
MRAILTVAVLVGLTSGTLADEDGGAAARFNPHVAVMKDNSWVKLPTPKVHPITRSSSPWMPYAPTAGAAFLWGCGHAKYDNDLWTYNLARNVWTEKLKTEPSAVADPDVIKIKDGVLMTRRERPTSFHQWGLLDYDGDREVLWYARMGGWQGVYNHRDHFKKIGREIRREGDAGKHARLRKTGPALWQYSLKTNEWKLIYTRDPSGCTRHSGYIRYFPPMRRLIMTPKWVSPNEDRQDFKMYDPAANKWEPLKVTWKPIDKGLSPYWVYGHSPIVYDAKRKALVLILGAGGTWLLDPAAKTMVQVVPKAKSLPSNLDGPVGAFVYDSVNATTLGIFADYKTYGGGRQLKARGFPADEAHVWALDVKQGKWVRQPRPADGVLPAADRGHMVHHFYDPVHNATVVYKGGYNSPHTETWVYRYRRRR